MRIETVYFESYLGPEGVMAMREVLAETLSAITAERAASFDRSFRLVRLLLHEYGEAELAERLVREISGEVPREVVADLFNILTWNTSDNGGAIQRAAEEWLRAGDDSRRIDIALRLEAYPFLDRSEMEKVLRRVALRYPETAARCIELIKSRRLLRQ